MPKINYQDFITFVKVTSDGYGSNKTVTQQVEVPAVFIQNTQRNHSQFQDSIDADALCYPDQDHAFITENFHRLEGMYILAPLFGAGDDPSWYRVSEVTTNRDHLLTNTTDNLELQLKKSKAIAGVS